MNLQRWRAGNPEVGGPFAAVSCEQTLWAKIVSKHSLEIACGNPENKNYPAHFVTQTPNSPDRQPSRGGGWRPGTSPRRGPLPHHVVAAQLLTERPATEKHWKTEYWKTWYPNQICLRKRKCDNFIICENLGPWKNLFSGQTRLLVTTQCTHLCAPLLV